MVASRHVRQVHGPGILERGGRLLAARSRRAAEAKAATKAATTKSSPIVSAVCCRLSSGIPKRTHDVWQRCAGTSRTRGTGGGFPDPRDWRRPRPIHARSETIDAKEPFRTPFHAGQRGIVVFRTSTRAKSREAVRQDRNPAMDGRPARQPPTRLRLCVVWPRPGVLGRENRTGASATIDLTKQCDA